tara:strand:- start:235 stop:1380 length:1146 start_codon:yes stop_codon:yes gene_type:complete
MIENYGSQDLRKIDLKKINFFKTLNIVTNGDFCKKFEKKISKLTGSKYSVVCNNGTSALLLAILALNKNNVSAILPNINFVAAPNIISLLKGKIILCDVNKDTGMVDLESFKKCLKDCKKKKISPNIFVPIHYAGDVLELEKISKLCKKNSIKIIEDGCHSFGSKKKSLGKTSIVGNCKYSEMTTFSFHPVKNITTLEGGAVTTNSKKIYNNLLLLRSHSLKKTKINDPYIMKYPTLNFRMSEINALIGIQQIKELQSFKNKRNQLVKIYIQNLKELKKNFSILNFYNQNVFWHIFVIKLRNSKIKKKLMLYLKKNRIGCQIHYKPIFMHRAFSRNIIINNYKESLKFYNSQLTLPLFTKMRNTDVSRIVNKMKIFFNKYR